MRYFNTIYIILLAILFQGCSKSINHAKYMEYIYEPKNGLLLEKKINNVSYRVSYRPSALMIYQHKVAKSNISKEEIKEIENNYNQYHHFLLSISANNREPLSLLPSFQDYSTTMQAMAFSINEHIYLVTEERDTLNMVDHHFARYFGHGSSNDILLKFEKEKKNTKNLIFYINELGFDTGNTRLYFDARKINKSNKLKIKI
jgi:hypothetical protein